MILTKSEHDALLIIKRSKNQSSMLGNRNFPGVNMIHNSCGKSLERKGVVHLKLGGDGNVFAHLNENITKHEFKIGDIAQILGTHSKATIIDITEDEDGGKKLKIDCGRNGVWDCDESNLVDPLKVNDWMFRNQKA